MNNEYDYSHLYQQNGQPGPNGEAAHPETPATPEAPAPQASQTPQAPDPAPADTAAAPAAPEAAPAPEAAAAPTNTASAYPNVGSSGMNTANTARTDYTEPAAGGAAQPAGQPGGAYNGYQYNYNYNPHTQPQGGYASSMNGGGAYNGYSYSSAPQPPQPPKKKHGGAKKVLLRILAGLLVLALGAAGGFGGAVLAARMGLAGSSVVVQQVSPRDDGDTPQGSAVGATLPLKDVASIVAPSVVVITTEQMVSTPYNWFGGSYVQSGAGSGVIMSEDGYILTCAHVVNGAQNIKVTLADDSEYTAAVVGADTSTDIAVIKIEATGLTPAVMGDSDTLAVGETVLAVGNPLGRLGGTVTDGIISAINREVSVQSNAMTLIQTNAAISPGNSGGGLFNANGELIGIVNAKSRSVDATGSPTEAEGLGFAIPVNAALSVARDLIDVGFVQRPALGITVITIDDAQMAQQYGVTNYGVYVYQVTQGSGADAAGVQMGDRIAAVADVPISVNSDLTDYLADCEVGDTVTLQIERDGRLITLDVTLGVSTQ